MQPQKRKPEEISGVFLHSRELLGKYTGFHYSNSTQKVRAATCNDALDVKLDLLYFRLNKKPNLPRKESTKVSPKISKSKLRSATFQLSREVRTLDVDLIKQIKQGLGNKFQDQFNNLNEQYQLLLERETQFVNSKLAKAKENNLEVEILTKMMHRVKEIAVDLTFSGKYFKRTSLLSKNKERKKERKMNYVEKTPNRQSSSPFQKDNSLLISVKRSMMEDLNAYNTMKISDKEFPISNEYKSSENAFNFQENPLLSTLQNNQKRTLYKDFIKETEEEEEEMNSAFDVFEESIRQKMRIDEKNSSKRVLRCRERMEQCDQVLGKLGEEIDAEKLECKVEWSIISDTFQRQTNSITDLLDSQRRSSQTLDKDRSQIFTLLQESLQSCLTSQRRTSKHEFSSILSHLREVISIFS